ncbi:hypothetical protein K435DRAFT_683541, partial [Dendrothele bispora CBS 962.96]
DYLRDMLFLEGRRGMGSICTECRSLDPIFRCTDDDCVLAGMMCQDCLVKTHKRLPLHWVEKWTGSYFRATSLQDLGLITQLGHGPAEGSCFFSHKARDITVIHTNGIHGVTVRFCDCGRLSEHRTQFLRIQWYPATPVDPQTAITFACLRLFQYLNCLGKLPAYDFYLGLELMTKSRIRRPPPDRYRVFLRCIFQWRHLKMCKRAARGHAIGGIAATQLGELALDCPACPNPGRNLPLKMENIPPELAFLYCLFLAMDANFRLRNRVVSNHYRSPTLGDGWAYFRVPHELQDHIIRHVAQEEMSSCSGFAAMFLANLKNVKGLRVSGVGGVCCGRHRVWRANGIGDLQKGEQYCNMDFIFWSTIRGEDYLCIVVSYDISCQWSRNFWSRMDDIDPSIKVKYGEGKIMFLVPKFHLRAHQASCQADYSFNYTPGVGQTHGEVVEEGWAQSNKAAGQTKEMGPGTRAMTLDDIFGFANWRTIENLGKPPIWTYGLTGIHIPSPDNVPGKRLLNAIKSYDEHYVDFKNFHSGLAQSVGETVLSEWDDMIKTWEGDHEAFCPYTMEEGGLYFFTLILRLLSDKSGDEGSHFKRVELNLAQEEHSRLSSGLPSYPSSFCVRAIELFVTVNKYMTATQDLELQRKRTTLLKRIVHFRNLQRLLMPRLSEVISEKDMQHVEDPDADKPEKIKLFLPSDCESQSGRIRACVGELPDVEARLREAEALDALQGIREGLRARTSTSRFKVRNVTGQVGNTRASGILRQIDIRIHSGKIRYRLARDALLRLRGHGDWEERLRDLKDGDVRGLSERVITREETERRERLRERAVQEQNLDDEDFYFQEEGMYSRVQGETRGRLSWIWWDQWELKNGSPDDPDYIDAVHVEYCKAKARCDRSREEVQLLCEELRRMMEYSLWKAEWWLTRRVGEEGMLAEGLNSYALQQTSYMHDRHQHLDKTWTPLIDHAQKVLTQAADIRTLRFELTNEERNESEMLRAEENV